MNAIYLNGLDGIIELITLIIVFAIVLAVTYFTTRWIGNYQSKTAAKGNIEVIEVRRITNNKSINIVRIADEYFAIAVGKDEINVIGKVEKEGINMPEVKNNTLSGDSFKKILDKLKKEKND